MFESRHTRSGGSRCSRPRVCSGKHDRGQFFRLVFFFFLSLRIQYGKVIVQYIQCRIKHILELLNVARTFFFFRRCHIGKLDKEVFRLGADWRDFVNVADCSGKETDIVRGNLAGFCQIVEEVFDAYQCINHRRVGFRQRLVLLQGKFGTEQTEMLQLCGQFFQPGQSSNRTVMHQLRGSFPPRLLLLDRLVMQHFFTQCLEKTPPQFAGVVYQFFNFKQARVCRLRLYGFAEVVGLRNCFVVLGESQGFLHQNHCFGDFNPLRLV